jgi:hypothetical protein
MAISFSISKEDLASSRPITPGAYTVVMTSVTKGPGKNDPSSDVITFVFTIESGPDMKAVGVKLKWWLSEKFPAAGATLIEALTGKPIPETGIELPDFEVALGRKVKAYIKNEMYNGRMTNKIDGFLTK